MNKAKCLTVVTSWSCVYVHVGEMFPFRVFAVAVCLKGSSLGDFSGGPMVKNLPSNAVDMGSIPGQGTKPTRHNFWAFEARRKKPAYQWGSACQD